MGSEHYYRGPPRARPPTFTDRTLRLATWLATWLLLLALGVAVGVNLHLVPGLELSEVVVKGVCP